MFLKVEGKLLQFHMANLEYACGAPLERVSALHWNQNESMLQFDGEHAWMESGFAPIIEKFAEGLDIQLGCEVLIFCLHHIVLNASDNFSRIC